MADELTTAIVSTVTITSTKTLTRTILSLTPAVTSILSTEPLPKAADLSSQGNEASLYPYGASLPLAVIFTILYFLVGLYHGYLSLYLPKRSDILNKHRITILIFVASLFSSIGYLLRCVSLQKDNNSNLPLYTISAVLIIISPIMICATLYLFLTRLIIRCLPSASLSNPSTPYPKPTASQKNLQKFFLLPPMFLGTLFIALDLVSFLTQVLGAGIAASNDWQPPALTRGTNIILSGLALQLTTFFLYLLIFHLFCRRVRNTATTGFNPCIMKVVTSMWIASGFLLLRTTFRLVEFASGPDGYAFQHEWCLYAFEAFPVWVAMAVLGWWHPIKWIQERVLAQAQEAVHLHKQCQGDVGGSNMHSGGMMNGAGAVITRKPVAESSGERQTRYMTGHIRRRSYVGNAI